MGGGVPSIRAPSLCFASAQWNGDSESTVETIRLQPRLPLGTFTLSVEKHMRERVADLLSTCLNPPHPFSLVERASRRNLHDPYNQNLPHLYKLGLSTSCPQPSLFPSPHQQHHTSRLAPQHNS
jgi:hypothetical protein